LNKQSIFASARRCATPDLYCVFVLTLPSSIPVFGAFHQFGRDKGCGYEWDLVKWYVRFKFFSWHL
jgi:hypothetical protein